ncbi:unnamed protein product [Rotaria sp. Silwood1]|nr:unnamed protein product [Rotaria sp. Silwood1]
MSGDWDHVNKTPLRYIIPRQITDLILVFENKSYKASLKYYTIDLYGYILKCFGNLKHLSIIGSYPHYYPSLVFSNIPLTTFFSSTLNKLCIRVRHFEDCLALFDGRLKQLTTLIIFIENMEYDSLNVYNMDDLPNLKCLSLTTPFCLTNTYDTQFLPLFHRMLNLEELTLYITIKNRTTFIDVDHLSKNDIQQTLNNIKYQEMNCIVNYGYSTAICYVFSLPFMFDDLTYIGNTYPSIVFNNVKRLTVKDEISFKHEFFNGIALSFPLLEELCVINIKPQSLISDKWNTNDNQWYSIIKFPYLISLRLVTVHIDYIDQFLNERKTHLPCLTELTVNYNNLLIVTEHFTRDATWLNCMKIKKLNVGETIEHTKHLHVYFPLLELCFFSY